LGAGADHEPDAQVRETQVGVFEVAFSRQTNKPRGIAMGTKNDFEEMNQYLEEKKVHFNTLLVDEPFTFADADKAYARLESGKFHGKIVIKTE
jgi:D-arabinose 1-dehydrogenase-like Zn-dependent alcohol dehydrogenase